MSTESERIRALEHELARLREDYNRVCTREKELYDRLHDTHDVLTVRMKWRRTGERLVTTLGQMMAALPVAADREAFEARDVNLRDDLLRRGRLLVQQLELMQREDDRVDADTPGVFVVDSDARPPPP